MRDYRQIELFKNVTPEQWNDWHWQVRNRITTVEQLKKVINLTDGEEKAIEESLALLRMAITPYYASLMDPDDPNCPIRKQAVPTPLELHRGEADLEDPLLRGYRFPGGMPHPPVPRQGTVSHNRPMLHVLPALYPEKVCRADRQCSAR